MNPILIVAIVFNAKILCVFRVDFPQKRCWLTSENHLVDVAHCFMSLAQIIVVGSGILLEARLGKGVPAM